MTLGSLPSITATTLLVVPRSIPMILPMANWPPEKNVAELGAAAIDGFLGKLRLRGVGYPTPLQPVVYIWPQRIRSQPDSGMNRFFFEAGWLVTFLGAT